LKQKIALKEAIPLAANEENFPPDFGEGQIFFGNLQMAIDWHLAH
jgi:hypothetical protein